MAQIPLGNFGYRTPSAAPAQSVPGAAFDLVGSGLESVADAAMQVQAEERKQADALERAKAANASLDYEITAKNIGAGIEQEVADGTLNYAEAQNAYKERLAEAGAPDTAGMNPVHAENLSRSIKRSQYQVESQISGVVNKARVADLRANVTGVMDKLGKQGGLPGADMNALTKQADGLDEIGQQAYGAEWGKKKQDWLDNTWDAHLNQQAMQASGSVKAIHDLRAQVTAGVYADKLDSNKRNSALAKLDAYETSLVQRQEAAAARAERRAERVMKVAEAEFNTFQSMADKGTTLDPAYIDRAVKLTAGTPYQAGIIALSKQAKETGGLAAQPVQAQQAQLDAIDAHIAANGRTPELDKRREQVSKVLQGSQADLKENGLRAGLERGVITHLAAFDMSSPEKFAATFAKRLEQAETVSLWAGVPVSPLDSQEAGSVGDMLAALPAKQRAQAVASMAETVGPKFAAALAEQIGKKDRALSLAFASSGAKTTEGRYTSEMILKGATAIKDGTVMKDDKKVTGWKATIAGELEGVFQNEKLTTAAKESAYYIAASIAQENGGSLGNSELRRAVRLAVGGEIIERNDKKLAIPAGMDEGTFEKRIKNVPASDILQQAPDGKVRVGGAEMTVEAFAKTIPGQELMFAGYGRYAVIVRGRPVTNSGGQRIIIGVQ